MTRVDASGMRTVTNGRSFFVPMWAAISRVGSYKCDLNFVDALALVEPSRNSVRVLDVCG